MTTGTVLKHPRGLYKTFPRKGGSALTATHYCPGCGHGIAHKLIGEALADLDIQDRSVMISPVGCAVFGYYYFDCGNIQAAHGRAPAVGTGVSRLSPDAVVISYQGDGDLCSIGLNEAFHAANRGEKMVIFFINNALYGMTGGQMAPTTLVGQKTVTSPLGRDPASTGYPLLACEALNVLKAPLYIERVSLADAGRIRKARQAVRKALQIQKDGKGFAFVEMLSPCPTNLHCTAVDAARFVTEQMEPVFPLGCLRDHSAEAQSLPSATPRFDTTAVDEAFSDYGSASADPVPVDNFPVRRIRTAGFGGQGVLSLGLMLALAGKVAKRFVTWMPSYGPEQRGGTANCSVVVAGRPIGSPIFADTQVLIAMNRPSLEHFGPEVDTGGTILYDAMIETPPVGTQARTVAVPALELATAAGAPKAANTAMLGVVAALGLTGLPMACFSAALAEAFSSKPKLIPLNQRVFDTAAAWAHENVMQ